MFIAELPVAMEESLTLRPPAGTVRNLEVRIEKRRTQQDGFIGLVVDGRYVPDELSSARREVPRDQRFTSGGRRPKV
jgi:hypothetical protein